MGRREESWPRGASSPARTATAAVEGNVEFALTTAQSSWLRGGGGRGDHGGASSEMAGAFLQRRASEAKAEQWRAAAARLLRAVGGEEKRNGTASAFGRRAG